MSLKSYVNQKNQWNALFGKVAWDISNPSDRKAIAESIDCDLSPENLSCDGELPRSQVNARYNRLVKAAKELQKIDSSITFWEL